MTQETQAPDVEGVVERLKEALASWDEHWSDFISTKRIVAKGDGVADASRPLLDLITRLQAQIKGLEIERDAARKHLSSEYHARKAAEAQIEALKGEREKAELEHIAEANSLRDRALERTVSAQAAEARCERLSASVGKCRAELTWVSTLADVRSKDESAPSARFNRAALRNIAERLSALVAELSEEASSPPPCGPDSQHAAGNAEIEKRAQEIYAEWELVPGYSPWVERGNSLMQDEARRMARYELDEPSGEGGEA